MNIALRDALFHSIPVLIGVFATGLAGSGLGYWWNLQLKKRETDLATMTTFHHLYGEFFAVWKLWDCYRRDIGSDQLSGASRWTLLERACAAEGEMEAILIELTAKCHADHEALLILAHFRQIYQQLRESIRADKALAWDYSAHPVYLEFKRLAPVVACMARAGGDRPHVAYTRQTDAWLYVTDNHHERFWSTGHTPVTSRNARAPKH